MRLTTIDALAAHIKEEHRNDISLKEKSFGSFLDFEEWKIGVRNDACIDFVARRQWRKTENYRSNVKHFNDDSVEVQYCLEHSGHEINRARLRLVPSEKALIAYYLREGNSTDWIVKKLRELHPLPSDRLFYISAQNVENIKMEWEVETSRLHAKDMASIAERVRRDADEDAENWSPFFSYSPAENQDGKGFRLGIMTREQEEWLKKYGNKGLCVDATHHSTRYKFLLVTVLVIDERQKGRPIAYYFCNAESEEELVPLFEGIKSRCGQLAPRIFMSDMAPAFFNAFTTVYGDATAVKKLVCAFHVMKSWRKRLYLDEHDASRRTKILLNLRVLTRWATREKFVQHLTALLSELTSMGREDFRRYLEDNYLTDEMLATWAPYNRRNEVVNTNTALERFHNTLKGNYLNRSENRRLDYTVQALLKYTADLSRDVEIMASVPSCFRQFRLLATHRNHRKALSFYNGNSGRVQSTADPNIYIVQSQSDANQSYVVKKLLPCACDSLARCRYDNCNVCYNEYECECFDSRGPASLASMHTPSKYAGIEDDTSLTDVSQPPNSGSREEMSTTLKNNIARLMLLIDGVSDDRQLELNAMVQSAIDFAVKNTRMVAPRQKWNGRPNNAPLQDVFKRTALATRKRRLLQTGDNARQIVSVPDAEISACSKCYKGETGSDWISCDRCNLWYHQDCAGVTEFAIDREFVCGLHTSNIAASTI
uniref:Zinc finger PHD-type domain-containing protein n=1 Tax=Plectus sambesii TaxID=2011161 RepID=A0A914W8R0_9BILA